MENFQDRGVWIRIRFVLRGWIRIRSISDRIRNPDLQNLFTILVIVVHTRDSHQYGDHGAIVDAAKIGIPTVGKYRVFGKYRPMMVRSFSGVMVFYKSTAIARNG